MTLSINNRPSFRSSAPLRSSEGKAVVKQFSNEKPMMCDTMLLSSRGQDASISSYKRRLKDIEKKLKECKPENYESQEEFQKEYDYWTQKYNEIQILMKEADKDYTTVNTEADTKKLSAAGQFIKDCCDGIKTIGKDIISSVIGFFGFAKAA